MKKFNLLSSSLILGLILGFSGCGSVEPAAPEVKKVESKIVEVKAVVPAKLVPIEKQGFLSTAKCIAAGAFTDCYLENYICGANGCYESTEPGVMHEVGLVLYSHVEGTTYKIDISKLNPADIDKSVNRNDVTIIGEYNASINTIHATELKAPPPPKKSFFKGCL
ncbi:hypothetical protein KKG72_01300 [bacterium]|nr:hypothetical protein [bacterium]MBU1994876.1 hypothetical protein [bacterium]